MPWSRCFTLILQFIWKFSKYIKQIEEKGLSSRQSAFWVHALNLYALSLWWIYPLLWEPTGKILIQQDGACRKQLEEGLMQQMKCLDLVRGQHGVVKFNISGGRLAIFCPGFTIYSQQHHGHISASRCLKCSISPSTE